MHKLLNEKMLSSGFFCQDTMRENLSVKMNATQRLNTEE